MKVEMTACDNPTCPELTDAEAYSWITAKVFWRGCGPEVAVTVCATACIEEAVHAAVARLHEDELEQQSSYREAVKAAIAAQACARCNSEPGMPCVSAKGITSAQPHAVRVHAAHAQMMADRA